jgi:exosortase
MADDPGPSNKPAAKLPPSGLAPLRPVEPRWVAIACVFGVILGWAYWPTFLTVGAAWLSNPDYTHGFFVIPISLWLLWLRREHAPIATMRIDWRGLLLLLLAGGIRCFAGRFYVLQLDAWSIPIWVAGVVWTLFGWQLLRWALPAIAFLWFATPLPGTIEIILSTPLQQLAASASAWVLRLIGQPALVQGTTILLDDKPLDVERACSGLRMFYGIFALAVACVALSRPERWKAVLVLFAAAPVAIIANVFRIVITALLMKFASNESAQKFSHDLAGIVMIPLAVTMFLVFLVLVGRVVDRMRDPRGVAWLIRWCVAGVVMLGLLLLWGQHQNARALSTYLDTAARYESDKDWPNAVKYLSLYVQSAPEDHDTYTRLARLYTEHSGSYQDNLRAVDLLRTAWKNQPGHEDLALSAIQVAGQIQDFDTSIQTADELLTKTHDPKTQSQALKLRAEALNAYLLSDKNRGNYNWNDVKDALEKELKLPDYETSHAILLAEVYRNPKTNIKNEQREKLATAVLDRVVAERPSDPVAWLGRFGSRINSANAADQTAAKADLDRAVELATKQPDNHLAPSVLLRGAAYYLQTNDPEGATKLLNHAMEMAPSEPITYLLLADVKARSHTKESSDQAIEILRKGLDRVSKSKSNQTVMLSLRYASLLADKGELDEAEANIAPAESLLTRLTGGAKSSLKLDVGIVRSQILLRRDSPQAAANYLSDVLDDSDVQIIGQQKPDVMAKAYAFLSQMYASLGLSDLALDSIRQAARFQPANPDWQIQSAMLAEQSGDLETASRDYQATLKNSQKSADVKAAMVEIELKRQLQVDAKYRNWQRAKDMLNAANQAGASPVAVRMLVAEILSASGDPKKAEETLSKLTEDAPTESAPWRTLALMRLQSGDAPGALKAADKFAAIANQPLDAASLKARILAVSGRTDDAIKLLTTAAEKADAKDMPKATITLSQLLSELGKTNEARSALEKAHEKDSKSLQIVDMLANMAYLQQDAQGLEKYESWLKTIEGEAGTNWRAYRAQRMLASSRAIDDADFREASAQVEETLRKRPHWQKAHFLQGEIAYRQNRLDTATAAYERSWKYGGRGILVTDRLIDLLTKQGRYDDARRYVGEARDYLAMSQGLFDRALPYLAEGERKDDTVRMAQLWVKQNPNDPEGHLRLGRVLLLFADSAPTADEKQKNIEQAKTEFRRAIDLAPTDVRPWAAIAMLYGQSPSARDEARQFLDDFSKQSKIGELERTFVLAQLYDMLGSPADAQTYYSRATAILESNPKAPGAGRVLGRAAKFYLPRVASLSETYARRALEIDPTDADARLVLLNLYNTRADANSAAEGLKLLDEMKGKGLIDSAAETRYRAAFLSRRGTPEELSAAIDVVRQSGSQSRDDKLLLARLYEQADQMPPAFDLLQQLVRAPNASASELTEFLRFWQQHFVATTVGKAAPQFAGQAREVYQQLEAVPGQLPESLRWRVRELKARKSPPPASIDACLILAADIVASPAAKNLNELGTRQLLQSVMIVLLQEQQEECAVKFATEPHGRVTPAELAICLCHAYVGVPQTKDNAAVRKQAVEKLLAAHPQNAAVLQAIADSAFMAAEYQTAADTYEKVIQIKPDESMSRNNRALALVELQKAEEARQVLATALKAKPNDIDLLDTQAEIDILEHHADKAIAVLEKLVLENPDNGVLRFHLATGYHEAKDTNRARDTLFAATVLGVEKQLLSPRDRKTLSDLKARYVAPADSVADAPASGESQARN